MVVVIGKLSPSRLGPNSKVSQSCAIFDIPTQLSAGKHLHLHASPCLTLDPAPSNTLWPGPKGKFPCVNLPTYWMEPPQQLPTLISASPTQ